MLLKKWLDNRGLGVEGYIVGSTAGPNVVLWSELIDIWPIEMLAALIDGASDVLLDDPLARTLVDLLNPTQGNQADPIADLQRRATLTDDPLDALITLAHAVALYLTTRPTVSDLPRRSGCWIPEYLCLRMTVPMLEFLSGAWRP